MHLPIDDLLPSRRTVTLTCPCDEGLARAANEITRPFYGGEAIELRRYLGWLERNPYILAVLTDGMGEVEGYFDILPLEATFLEEFVAGRATEADIGADVILPPERMHECKRLYLGGVTIRDPLAHKGRRHASMLIWGMLRYLQAFYGGCHANDLLALASTFEGERLLRGFRFRLEVGASKRTDRHDLFSHPIDRQGREQLAMSAPDWTNQCELAFRGLAPDTRVFVSYRREDAIAVTGRLVDRLRAALGSDAVFFDIETIAYGRDFRSAIDEALRASEVVLAMIGPRWMDSMRIKANDGVDDYVVVEIESALRLGKVIVPILIDGARMPEARDLPTHITEFAYRNAMILDSGVGFERGVNTVLDAIRSSSTRSPNLTPPRTLRGPWSANRPFP